MQLHAPKHEVSRTNLEQVSLDLEALDLLLEKVQAIYCAREHQEDKEAENLALQQLSAHEAEFLAEYLENPDEISEYELVKGWLYSHKNIQGNWRGPLSGDKPDLTSICIIVPQIDPRVFMVFDESKFATIFCCEGEPLQVDVECLVDAIWRYMDSLKTQES